MVGGTDYFSNYFTETQTTEINSNYEVYIFQNGKNEFLLYLIIKSAHFFNFFFLRKLLRRDEYLLCLAGERRFFGALFENKRGMLL